MKTIILTLLVGSLYSLAPSSAGTRPTLKKLEKIKVSMRKLEVIRALGSPYTSFRRKGQDHWIYHFYKNKKDGIVEQVAREVHFKQGLVSYVGPKKRPKLSAEERDEVNRQSNLNELQKWEEHKKKAVTARKEYDQWVLKVKGKDANPDAVVPRFKSVD